VRLRASPGIIHALTQADVSAQIDLSGAKEGERIIHLTADSIRVPFGVKVVRISPASLILRFEETLQKEVPVRPRVAGQPASGYEVGEVTSRPASVRVSGPRSRVEKVGSAFTEAVPLESARAPITLQRNIGLEDSFLRILGNPSVRVTVQVREEERTRTFGVVAVAARGGAASLRPRAVRIVVAGPASLVDPLVPSNIRPYVDVAGLAAPGLVPVTVEILPGQAGLRIESVEPREIAVRPARKKE